MAFNDMVQTILGKMKKGKVPEGMAGIGKYGPSYNPGVSQTFTPGPQAEVPFMPQAQVGPQQIAMGDYSMQGPHGVGQPPVQPNLGLGGPGGNPNNMPGYAPTPGQTANYNAAPGTQAGSAAPHLPLGMNPAAIQAALALVNKAKSEPQPWVQFQPTRWGGR